MITLTFSRAIPVFFVIQTLLFLLLLMVSEKKSHINTKLNISKKALSTIMVLLYVILIISDILLLLGRINYVFQTIIATIIPATIVPLLVMNSEHKLMFAIVLLWHLLLLGLTMPPDLLSITEGVHMTRTMVIYGKWLPELAHNPSYNPFPTMAFLRVALSYTTGIPWFSWFIAYAMLLITTLAFDLAVYSLALRATPSHNTAILAVIISALTPYLVVTGHAYQVPATIMWLLSIAILIKTLREPKKADFIPIILLYVAAILTHTTAYVAMMFPLMLIILKLIFERKEMNLKIHPVMKAIIIIFLTLGIFRIAYEELYVKYVYNLGYSGIKSLVSNLLTLLTLSSEEEGIRLKFSLYDYSGIPFYQAFLWALTASLATAITIYNMLRKRINIVILTSFISGALFIGLGYLSATLVVVSTQLYRGTYVAFSFLIPLAAETIRKVINSRKRSLALIVIFILIFSSFLATRDPEISPLYKLKSRGIPEKVLDMAATQSDIVKADIIINSVNEIEVFNNLTFYSKYSLRFERLTTYGESIPMFYSRLSDALYKALYMRGYTIKDAPIANINIVDLSKLSTLTANYSIIINFGDEIVFKA
jgi:hypothetical protein